MTYHLECGYTTGGNIKMIQDLLFENKSNKYHPTSGKVQNISCQPNTNISLSVMQGILHLVVMSIQFYTVCTKNSIAVLTVVRPPPPTPMARSS